MKRKKSYSLRGLRKEAGLTLQQLSERTGINLCTIQALETGRGKGFNVVIKQTLADYFHCPMRVLFPELNAQIELLLGKKRQIQMFLPREEIKKD